ncbi:DUF2019 domain-containing protein [Anaerosinus massiliensis]|uniref:DUF2019 domain-containing protein n=1 Tax=Massilibacillus massiliensis TaxID=1806837 RepID=UPI000DA5FDC9|nr:DUF2019 domain-containing protein [Massilibacillus massiliensis]
MRKLEKILRDYESACIKGEEAQENGDSKNSNKKYRVIQKIRKELKENTEYGLEKLLPYLEHPSPFVRLKTAFSIIPVAPEKAKEVLIQLKEIRGLIGYSAEMILSEWEKENLKFD